MRSKILVEQLVEGVDLVAHVGESNRGGTQDGSQGQEGYEAGAHGFSIGYLKLALIRPQEEGSTAETSS